MGERGRGRGRERERERERERGEKGEGRGEREMERLLECLLVGGGPAQDMPGSLGGFVDGETW